jgi:hypothetical protein
MSAVPPDLVCSPVLYVTARNVWPARRRLGTPISRGIDPVVLKQYTGGVRSLLGSCQVSACLIFDLVDYGM